MLSGVSPFRGAYETVNREPDEPSPWKRELWTYDEILAQGGYHVEWQGKWHTGDAHRDCYEGRSLLWGHRITPYHEYLRRKYGSPDPISSEKTDRYSRWPYTPWKVDELLQEAQRKGFMTMHHNEAGIVNVADEDSLTAWTVRRTIEYLDAGPAQPFCTTCSILHPHAPLIATERYARMFDPASIPIPVNLEANEFTDKPAVPGGVPVGPEGLGQFAALYYGLVAELDHWVGRLLDSLDRNGLTGRTLVVFLADHGELMGAHGVFAKSLPYEESVRVPMILRLPGAIPAGAALDAPVVGVDLGPTILDYCGESAPEGQMDGQSLRGAIEGTGQPRNHAIIVGRNWQAIRSREYKLIRRDGGDLLFDLQADPGETENLLAAGRKDGASVRLAGELGAALDRGLAC
jgi:arylsulfatase A-like enzyme